MQKKKVFSYKTGLQIYFLHRQLKPSKWHLQFYRIPTMVYHIGDHLLMAFTAVLCQQEHTTFREQDVFPYWGYKLG